MPSGKHKHGYHQNVLKCARYRLEGRLERNKLHRILRCNGLEAAKKWAEERNVTSVLKGILKRRASA